MNILITGCAGFIGYHLTKDLLEENHNIIGVDNLNDYYSEEFKKLRLNELKKFPNFSFSLLGIENFQRMKKIFEKNNFNLVINLAAQAGVSLSVEKPRAYFDSNILGFFNILELCKEFKIKRLIYASSSSVYGDNLKIPFSSKNPADHPKNFYAASKRSNELFAHSFSRLYQLETIGLRFFTVYGPWGRPDMAVLKFIKNIDSKKEIFVHNNGKHLRDMTYIDDCIQFIKKSIKYKFNKTKISNFDLDESFGPWKIFNVSRGETVKLNTLINIISEKLNIKPLKKLLPLQKGEVLQTFGDISISEKELSFQPSVSIEDGIEKTVDWYLLNKNKIKKYL